MAKCIVIGGGLAGLSSAVFLTGDKHDVLLLEASPKLGGRAYSFLEKSTSDIIDNGQHILMGAYKNTFEFLEIIGTKHFPLYQNKLQVVYLDKSGKKFTLKAPHTFYPLNLIQAILNFKLISSKERLSILRLMSKLLYPDYKLLKTRTVLQWLKENNQSEKAITKFWKLLVVSTLNTSTSEASAKIFVKVLKEIFLNGNKSSTIVLPQKGLSELFNNPAEKYLNENGTEISLSEKVIAIEVDDNKVIKIRTAEREITDFDFVISAVPFHSLQKILPELPFIKLVNEVIETSPIITLHLWLNKNIFEEKFYGFIDSKIHWVYQNKNHISVVISSAKEMIELESEEIFRICMDELKIYFPEMKNSDVLNYKLLKEKRATFKATPQSCAVRTQIKSPYKNFILAGDWTNTKLPATIEGAILSGKKISKIF